jgi:hypothetical protein
MTRIELLAELFFKGKIWCTLSTWWWTGLGDGSQSTKADGGAWLPDVQPRQSSGSLGLAARGLGARGLRSIMDRCPWKATELDGAQLVAASVIEGAFLWHGEVEGSTVKLTGGEFWRWGW